MCELFAIEKASKIIYINMYKGWNIFSATANGRCDIIKNSLSKDVMLIQGIQKVIQANSGIR